MPSFMELFKIEQIGLANCLDSMEAILAGIRSSGDPDLIDLRRASVSSKVNVG